MRVGLHFMKYLFIKVFVSVEIYIVWAISFVHICIITVHDHVMNCSTMIN